MARSAFILVTFVLAWVMGATGLGQATPPGSAQWADTVASDYDVSPDITYRTANNTDLKLDVYAPRDRRSPVPAVMLIHGGGWVEGRKEYNVLSVLPYLALGWAVVNVEYRLARNSPAPAAVEDCRCALAWIAAHAKEYGFDTSKIVLTGNSAGGHLALITGLLPASSAFDRSCPTDDDVRWDSGAEPALKVAAIVNWFGITDVADLLEGPNAKHYAIEWFGSMSQREELARQLSPIQYVRPGLPPVLTIHGDADDLVPYSHAVRLHEALGKAGVPNRLVTIRGGGHGNFSRQQMADNYDAIRAFLREQHLLGGAEATPSAKAPK
jgi:acetyl esterase/lipase